MFRKLIFGVILLMVPVNSFSQQLTYDGCLDFNGVPVATIQNTNIQDIAMAYRLPNGTPLIIVNPNVMVWVHPITRAFFYWHECSHHYLGHTLGMGYPFSVEQEADCNAMIYMRNNGLMDEVRLGIIQRDLARCGPGDWTHLPGPIRSINAAKCLGVP